MNRPRAYVELARLRLAEATRAPAAPSGRLSRNQAADILELHFAARRLPPPDVAVYELIADVWSQCEVRPTNAHLAVVDEAALLLFPRSSSLAYKAAALRAQFGFTAEASDLIRWGLQHASDPTEVSAFVQLQASLGR